MTAITQAITALPAVPDPATMTPAQFSNAAAAFVLAQKAEAVELETFRVQVNALAAGLNAVATGSALAIPLTFSTTTTDSDPGAGNVRLDNATQNAATTIRTDLLGSDGSDWSAVEALFDDSTSTIKGFITLRHQTDGTKFLVFSVTSLASPSGYKNVTVAPVASSATNPFSNGDALVLQFIRNGDKGDTGATGATGASAAPFVDSTALVKGSADATKLVRFEADGLTTETTRTITVPDENLTLAGRGANTFTAAQIYGDQQNSRAMLIDCGYTYLSKGNSSTTTQTFDYTAGSHQSVTATGNHTIATSNWPPTGNLGEMLVEYINGGAYTLTWPTISWIKPDGTTTTSIATYLSANTGRTALATSGTDFILLWSRDAGTTIYGKLC